MKISVQVKCVSLQWNPVQDTVENGRRILNATKQAITFNCISDAHASHIAFGEWFNTLRPRKNGRHSTDDIFRSIFLNENVWSSLKISLKFVPEVLINSIPTLVQIITWCRPGDKPSFEPMMLILPTHICITRRQWFTTGSAGFYCYNERGQLDSSNIFPRNWPFVRGIHRSPMDCPRKGQWRGALVFLSSVPE